MASAARYPLGQFLIRQIFQINYSMALTDRLISTYTRQHIRQDRWRLPDGLLRGIQPRLAEQWQLADKQIACFCINYFPCLTSLLEDAITVI